MLKPISPNSSASANSGCATQQFLHFSSSFAPVRSWNFVSRSCPNNGPLLFGNKVHLYIYIWHKQPCIWGIGCPCNQESRTTSKHDEIGVMRMSTSPATQNQNTKQCQNNDSLHIQQLGQNRIDKAATCLSPDAEFPEPAFQHIATWDAWDIRKLCKDRLQGFSCQ